MNHKRFSIPENFLKFFGGVFIVLIFIGLAAWSWRKWPDILIDFGHELYVPWQLSEGKVLYRDIAIIYGPFSQYFNALWFKIFGVSLSTLIFCNLALLAGLTCLVYQIFTDTCNRLTAVFVCLVLLCVFGFSQYEIIGNSNYICPYSHEAVHGVIFSVLMIFFFHRYHKTFRPIFLVSAGICLGCVFLTKPEVAAAAIVSALVFLFLIFLSQANTSSRKHFRPLLAFAGSAFIPIILFFFYFIGKMNITNATHAILGAWMPLFKTEVLHNIYFKKILGFDTPASNIGRMLCWTGVVGAFIWVTVLLDKLCSHGNISRIASQGCGIAIFVILLLLQNHIPWLEVPRSFPLLVGGAVVYFAWRIWRNNLSQKSFKLEIPLLVWSVFSLALLAKMLLNVRVYHYGFYLAMPAALIAAALFIYTIPSILYEKYGGGRLFQGLALAVVTAGIIFHLETANRLYRQKDFAVSYGGDKIITYGPNVYPAGQAAAYALKFIETRMPPKATLMTLPDGSMLNYLGRRLNPTPYLYLMVTDIAIFGGELKVVENLRSQSPDYIFMVHKPTEEYGTDYFGANPGYGKDILEWINQNYIPVGLIGSEPLHDRRFGIKIFKRRDSLVTTKKSGS